MVLRRFVFGLVLTAVLGGPVSASAGSVEDCRALHGVKRKTALERWRGPRSNANKYPLYCENEKIAAAVPQLSNLNLGNLSGGGLGNGGMSSGGGR